MNKLEILHFIGFQFLKDNQNLGIPVGNWHFSGNEEAGYRLHLFHRGFRPRVTIHTKRRTNIHKNLRPFRPSQETKHSGHPSAEGSFVGNCHHLTTQFSHFSTSHHEITGHLR